MPFDPFRPLSPPERDRQLAGYLAFLDLRDGTPDLAERRLSARDDFFATLEEAPVRSRLPIDAAAFRRALAGEDVADADPRVWWLAVAAKANRGERYGVELALDAGGPPSRPHDAFVPLEEVYHTRILLDCCAIFGLDVDMIPPPWGTRQVIHAMDHAPAAVRLPLVLAGEVTGCGLFQLLLDRLDLFDEEPEVAERLGVLLRSILVDELGHVAYCRARLSRMGLWTARRMLPHVARSIASGIPEIGRLAGGTGPFVERVLAFRVATDPEVRSEAFDADAA